MKAKEWLAGQINSKLDAIDNISAVEIEDMIDPGAPNINLAADPGMAVPVMSICVPPVAMPVSSADMKSVTIADVMLAVTVVDADLPTVMSIASAVMPAAVPSPSSYSCNPRRYACTSCPTSY